MSGEVLSVQGLSAGYGPLRVIHDLDLMVAPGERVGIVGLNGHGKTTLFRALTGLSGWQSGSIRLRGEEIGERRMTAPGRRTHKIARRGLALIPQGDAIFPGLTVEQNLLSGASSKQAWRERQERMARVLETFPPLEKLRRSAAGNLSGGERRMVSLGRGLMGDVSVYLIDEPSLGLAPKIASAVLKAVHSIDVGEGAMLIAEQNIALLEGRVDRILGMHAGRLKQAGHGALAMGGGQL
jgi:branched-chain amino acid transport system ATP-binding protein